jgi:hypothetical protein
MDDGTFSSVVLGSGGTVRPDVEAVCSGVLSGELRLLTFFGTDRVWRALLEVLPNDASEDELWFGLLDGYDVGIDFLSDSGYRVPLASFEAASSAASDRASGMCSLWEAAAATKLLARRTSSGSRSVWVPSASAKECGGSDPAPFRRVGDCLVESWECGADQSWMSGDVPTVASHFPLF